MAKQDNRQHVFRLLEHLRHKKQEHRDIIMENDKMRQRLKDEEKEAN